MLHSMTVLLVLCGWVTLAGPALLVVVGACRAGHREDVARALVANEVPTAAAKLREASPRAAILDVVG
jgi:hypothetical protein